MSTIVIYKSKYGSAKQYAGWIAQELGCKALDAKDISPEMLKEYDTIIYGGGLYAEIIAGVSLITKNIDEIKSKKIIVYSTGLTPPDCREYYDTMVWEKNFKPEVRSYIKMFNFPGKMIVSELSLVHKAAIKTLKKIMSGKENPTQMEKMLIDLCDADGDFSDKSLIKELIEYAKS